MSRTSEPTELDEFLDWLRDWVDAYPEDIFRPIDMRDVGPSDYTQEEVLSIASRNAAGMARHVLSRVLENAERLKDSRNG
jgi:hypothetical protein